MLDWIKSILDNYTNGMYFPNIHIKDVIEILIVAVIVYEIMLRLIKTERMNVFLIRQQKV